MNTRTLRFSLIAAALVAIVGIVTLTYLNATRIAPGVQVKTPAGTGVVITDEMQLAMCKDGTPLIGYKVRVVVKGKPCDIGFATKYLTRQ